MKLMLKIVVAMMVVVFLLSSMSHASNLSTPQDAWITWFNGMISGDLNMVLSATTSYGAVGEVYRDRYFNRHGVLMVSEVYRDMLPNVSSDQVVMILNVFKDSWKVAYLSDTTVLLIPNILGEEINIKSIMVKEGEEWKVSLIMQDIDLYFDVT